MTKKILKLLKYDQKDWPSFAEAKTRADKLLKYHHSDSAQSRTNLDKVSFGNSDPNLVQLYQFLRLYLRDKMNEKSFSQYLNNDNFADLVDHELEIKIQEDQDLCKAYQKEIPLSQQTSYSTPKQSWSDTSSSSPASFNIFAHNASYIFNNSDSFNIFGNSYRSTYQPSPFTFGFSSQTSDFSQYSSKLGSLEEVDIIKNVIECIYNDKELNKKYLIALQNHWELITKNVEGEYFQQRNNQLPKYRHYNDNLFSLALSEYKEEYKQLSSLILRLIYILLDDKSKVVKSEIFSKKLGGSEVLIQRVFSESNDEYQSGLLLDKFSELLKKIKIEFNKESLCRKLISQGKLNQVSSLIKELKPVIYQKSEMTLVAHLLNFYPYKFISDLMLHSYIKQIIERCGKGEIVHDDNCGNTALNIALKKPDISANILNLLSCEEVINKIDYHGLFPLYYAVMHRKDPILVKLFLELGANPNQTMPYGLIGSTLAEHAKIQFGTITSFNTYDILKLLSEYSQSQNKKSSLESINGDKSEKQAFKINSPGDYSKGFWNSSVLTELINKISPSDIMDDEQEPTSQILTGEQGRVHAMTVLKNGKLAFDCSGNKLKVLDPKTGRFSCTTAHERPILSLAALSNNVVIGGFENGEIKFWDFTGKYDWRDPGLLLGTLDAFVESRNKYRDNPGHKNAITALAVISPELLVSGSRDKTMKVWGLTHYESGHVYGQCLKTLFGHNKTVSSLAVLPSGYIVSGSFEDKTIKVWNIKTDDCIRTLKGHSDGISDLVVRSNGQIVSGSWDKTIKVWDKDTDQCVKTLDNLKSVAKLAWLDHLLICGCGDGTIKIWDIDKEVCIQTLSQHQHQIRALAVLPNKQLASATLDDAPRIWDLSNLKCHQTHQQYLHK